ncbi:hypothetical protein [uncultured Tenacibaculum sp.]|uniref:hypothetical protein n=1 Tax=uncultured Tenacibaculum sp. TaxID=174713 RepID=UPI00260312EA|nr:hypothetical protein [uncultured Tenacibaculum sp.]
MKLKLFLTSYFILIIAYAQNSISLDRLRAIKNENLTFYNVDGIRISKQDFSYSFNKKGLKKAYRKYRIKKKDLKTKDSLLLHNHFLVTTETKINDEFNQYDAIYFIENSKKQISVIFFNSYKRNPNLEREFIDLAIKNKIPKDRFAEPVVDMIDFAGRLIQLGPACKWQDINNVQCPYSGQMNWSIHKNLNSAKKGLNFQLVTTKMKKNLKVLSEESIPIEFEGTDTKATKIVYDIKGTSSLLVGLSGAKSLTVFYVACKVRNNYVSCILSFWNNDSIRKSGLPPLLEEVMKIKNVNTK